MLRKHPYLIPPLFYIDPPQIKKRIPLFEVSLPPIKWGHQLRALAPNNIHCARSAECVLFYFYFRLSHISHITHILHICDKHFSHFTQKFLTFLTFSCVKLIICKKPFSHFTQMCKTISHISHILHKIL